MQQPQKVIDSMLNSSSQAEAAMEKSKTYQINPLLFGTLTEKFSMNCPICYYEIEDPCYCLQCKHPFCSQCIYQHGNRDTKKCPMCRANWKALTKSQKEDVNDILKCYKDKEESHSYTCQFCGEAPTDLKQTMKEHASSCSNTADCPFCKY